MTVWLYAEFTAKPGREDELKDLVRGLAKDVRAEPGNQVFVPLVRSEDRCRYVVIEQYRDEAAFQAHLDAPYGAVFNGRLGDLIEEDGAVLSFLSPIEE